MDKNFPFERFLGFDERSSSSRSSNILPEVPELAIANKAEVLPNSSSNSQQSSQFDLDELNNINKEVLTQLKNLIPSQKFTAFFQNNFSLVDIQDHLAIFATTTAFIRTIILNQYKDQIVQSLENILGQIYKVEIQIVNSKASLSSNDQNLLNSISNFKSEDLSKQILSPEKRNQSAKDVTFTIDLIPSQTDLQDRVESKMLGHLHAQSSPYIDPKKTFDNFIVGPSNHMAHASAMAVAKNPGKMYPSLYLHSNSGLGKTHLLHAMANALRDATPNLKVCLITGRDFMNEMVEAIRDKSIMDFRKKYSEKIDVLMIDDIHEVKNREGTQDELFHAFNELHNKGKQLIFTSDKRPKEIDGLAERIKTRLAWGLVVDIQPPDLETRMAILRKKAQDEDIFLPDDVVSLIAGSIKSNIRELEASLIKLGAYSSLFQVDIDIEIAKQQLKLTESLDPKNLTIDMVAKAVSNHFKIPVPDIRSKVRLKDVTLARHIAMYLSYQMTQQTLNDIGVFFGGRDHTSVLHAVDKIKRQLRKDVNLSLTITEIENHF